MLSFKMGVIALIKYEKHQRHEFSGTWRTIIMGFEEQWPLVPNCEPPSLMSVNEPNGSSSGLGCSNYSGLVHVKWTEVWQ